MVRVEEHEVIGVFEEPNNEYSSNEPTALKKELCNFTEGCKICEDGKCCCCCAILSWISIVRFQSHQVLIIGIDL